VLAQGAVIAHHHGVGLSRVPYMDRAHGEARRWFEALKPVLDPAGIFNPGKVFSE
jgi:FAD/FMN-containing dehydrogenase